MTKSLINKNRREGENKRVVHLGREFVSEDQLKPQLPKVEWLHLGMLNKSEMEDATSCRVGRLKEIPR